MPLVNESVLHVWALGITGLDGNMTTDLDRYQDANTRADASETVTIAEIGVSGQYAITYTPTLAQLYVGVVTESSLGMTHGFSDDVQSAPSAAAVDDSYCSIADVVAFAQIGTPGSSTIPTETEVLGFMAKRAGLIYGRLATLMGASAPGPDNWDVTIDTGTDKGKSLSQSCRFVNAIGAAMDQLAAAGAGEQPARSERVAELGTLYAGAMADLTDAAVAYAGFGGRYATHISAGEVTRGTVTSREQQGLVVTDQTEF